VNKKTLKALRKVSQEDKKTLDQKCLKLGEEYGELAQVILPYVGAHGCKHKVTGEDLILEESVDVLICALSILYQLDIPDSKIDLTLQKKLAKWQRNLKKKVNK
jgi:NTP pyrophosphatase (non-canonical NTP hydrolase)